MSDSDTIMTVSKPLQSLHFMLPCFPAPRAPAAGAAGGAAGRPRRPQVSRLVPRQHLQAARGEDRRQERRLPHPRLYITTWEFRSQLLLERRSVTFCDQLDGCGSGAESVAESHLPL